MVVHFIKKNMWYLETAMALLHGDEVSEAEEYEKGREAERERAVQEQRVRAKTRVTAVGQGQDKVQGVYSQGKDEGAKDSLVATP